MRTIAATCGLLLVLACAASAQAPVAPADSWTHGQTPEYCYMSRAVDAGGQQAYVLIQSFGTTSPYHVVVRSAALPVRPQRAEVAQISFGDPAEKHDTFVILGKWNDVATVVFAASWHDVRQFGEIRLDQSLMPLVTTLATVGSLVPVASGLSEKVIYIGGNNVLPSLQSYVVLTSRAAGAVHVGDRFTLIDDSVDPRYPAPPVPAAVAEVVKVTPFAVTAMLIDQDQPRIRTGMTARLTARLP